MSSLDDLLESIPTVQKTEVNVLGAIRKLATNKDIRIFLTSLCRYSKTDWAALVRTCKIVYQVAQTSMLVTNDSPLLDELVKTPHFAIFFRRLMKDE